MLVAANLKSSFGPNSDHAATAFGQMLREWFNFYEVF